MFKQSFLKGEPTLGSQIGYCYRFIVVHLTVEFVELLEFQHSIGLYGIWLSDGMSLFVLWVGAVKRGELAGCGGGVKRGELAWFVW